MLDTSACVELLRGNPAVRNKCIEEDDYCCISIITEIELLYGALCAPTKYRETEIAKAHLLTQHYDVLGIDEIAEPFCREIIHLERDGNRIEDFDLLIGITARENNLAVVTTNTKHFERIKDLSVENWTIT